MVTPLVNGSPAQGTIVDPVDAIQQLSVNGTGGTFTLTYAPVPMGVVASQDAGIGTLTAPVYFYEISAVTSSPGETLPSAEVFDQVSPNAAIDLSWSPMPGETGGYKIYRGTTSGSVIPRMLTALILIGSKPACLAAWIPSRTLSRPSRRASWRNRSGFSVSRLMLMRRKPAA